ncbi:GNAT family N-acetyltransferase [Promicromonospora sp. NPDC050880]|uniref:GNAT family N-acetyltransferase n=1 Tax=Promicromonospora sp. NPDC050880 TaxID=3364406 RepID=UPI0037A6B0F3
MLHPATPDDIDDLAAFLRAADLTVAALAEPAVRLWLDRDDAGAVCASTGFELGTDGEHALVRSVAVRPDLRGTGSGLRLARFALDRAADAGARQAWLFSRRSGGFWQRLGFERTTTDALAAALPDAHQVLLFRSTGQLDRETAWHRPLPVRARFAA